jgi:hypothetical protein
VSQQFAVNLCLLSAKNLFVPLSVATVIENLSLQCKTYFLIPNWWTRRDIAATSPALLYRREPSQLCPGAYKSCAKNVLSMHVVYARLQVSILPLYTWWEIIPDTHPPPKMPFFLGEFHAETYKNRGCRWYRSFLNQCMKLIWNLFTLWVFKIGVPEYSFRVTSDRVNWTCVP